MQKNNITEKIAIFYVSAAFSSQPHFARVFLETLFDFSKMDKNKCPKSKTQFTF
jgi:hypothetical protein